MTSHKDKGILNISYNHLSQINNITFDQTYIPRDFSRPVNVRSLYLYNSQGEKLRKNYYHKNPNLGGFGEELVITDYLDGFQYESKQINDNAPVLALKFIPTSEGYFNFENNKYIYNYTDHLGNVRLSYFNNGSGIEVLEENNYYSFGLKHEGYNSLWGNSAYQYKYNGKELQIESGMYDYGARMYMPDLGRWGVVDPLAEKMTRHSPYNYAFNNPLRFIDPDGREGEDWFKNSLGDMEFKPDIKSQQDLTDKGIKGEYVGETYQKGNLTYAADGKVYDDSVSGGGLPIENGKVKDIEGVTITQKPSTARQTWNFVADNIISKPIEGVQFFGYFFYGLGQVPGEMYKQGRMENIHVKMDMTLWGFKNGSIERKMKYIDGETVMTEQEKFEKIAVPGIEALSFGVGTKLNLIKQPVVNFGAKIGIKTAVKQSIYKTAEF
jgi:RHS repeat-associated protein